MTFNRAIRAASGLTIAALAIAASPAAANETGTATQTAAAAQMTGAIDTNAASALGNGDREFTQLFASWKDMERGAGGSLAAPRQAVSVPSLMPVDVARMSSGFGMRNHPVLGGRRQHTGIDLAAPTGTPVYATADGYVAKAERWSSYGNYIQIEHGGDMHTRYAHLSGYNVAAGQYVRKGDLIGFVGSTGRSTGPHLHYEVRIAGEAVDPRPYMLSTQLALADASEGQGDGEE
jgi:murein DD-endopeptidase MepM/ murein hydrolase activator NlpD